MGMESSVTLSVKDFLMFSWQFPYEHLYTDHDCTVVRYQASQGTCYNLVYRDTSTASGFKMVPFYYVGPDEMDQMVDSSNGLLTDECIEFLYRMLG